MITVKLRRVFLSSSDYVAS